MRCQVLTASRCEPLDIGTHSTRAERAAALGREHVIQTVRTRHRSACDRRLTPGPRLAVTIDPAVRRSQARNAGSAVLPATVGAVNRTDATVLGPVLTTAKRRLPRQPENSVSVDEWRENRPVGEQPGVGSVNRELARRRPVENCRAHSGVFHCSTGPAALPVVSASTCLVPQCSQAGNKQCRIPWQTGHLPNNWVPHSGQQ